MTSTPKAINAGLAFLLELAMLAGLGYWGWHGEKSIWLKWILAIGLPLLVMVPWGYFLAPRSEHRLAPTAGNLLSLGLFLLAAAAVFETGHATLAILFAATAIVNRALIVIWKQW